jgi:hypothetical protein
MRIWTSGGEWMKYVKFNLGVLYACERSARFEFASARLSR